MNHPKPSEGDLIHYRDIPGKVGTVIEGPDHKGSIYVAWHSPRTLQSVNPDHITVMSAEERATYLAENSAAAKAAATYL